MPDTPSESAVELLTQANAAEAAGAWDEAARFYEQALASDDARDRAGLLAAVARTSAKAGQYRPAWKALQMSLDLYRAADDGLGFGRAVEGIGPIHQWASPAQVPKLWMEALERLGDADEVTSAALGVRMNIKPMSLALAPGQGAALLAKAREVATRRGLDSLLASVARMEAVILVSDEGRFDEGIERLREGYALGERGLDLMHANTHRAAGNLNAAAEVLEAYIRQPEIAADQVKVASAQLAAIFLLRGEDERVMSLAAEFADETNANWRFVIAYRALLSRDAEGALASLGNPDTPGQEAAVPSMVGLLWAAGRRDTAAALFAAWPAKLAKLGARGLAAGEDLGPDDVPLVALSGFGDAAPALANETERRALIRIITKQPAASAARGFDMQIWCAQRVYADWALRLDMPADAERLYRDALAWSQRERCPIEEALCWRGLAWVAGRIGTPDQEDEYWTRSQQLFREHHATLYVYKEED